MRRGWAFRGEGPSALERFLIPSSIYLISARELMKKSPPPQGRPSYRFSYTDLVRPDWFKDPMKGSIWVRAYAAPKATKDELPEERLQFDIGLVRGTVSHGVLKYFNSPRPYLEPTSNGDARFRIPPGGAIMSTIPGTYLVLVTPHVEEGVEPREETTLDVLDEVDGLLIGSGAHALVFQRTFDNVISLSGTQIILPFGEVDNAGWYDKPDLRPQAFQMLNDVHQAIELQGASLRQRMRLSLRWLASAGHDRGVDSFLKLWIALETLALPEGITDIGPANALLAEAYGLSRQEVGERFCLGRLQNLRSEIVHNGKLPKIPGEVSKFFEGLYFDLLFAVLARPSQRRAAIFER